MMTNPYGDVELDARGMRALAHPVRLAILEQLRSGGPNTATGLSTLVGASPSVTSWHLRHLAEHGLVEDADAHSSGRKRWWRATSSGFRFSSGDDEARSAALALTAALEQLEGDLVGQWREQVEPQLEVEWRRLSGRANTQVLLTVDELTDLEAAFEELLAPYVRRKNDGTQRSAGARQVRFLRYTLPGLDDEQPPEVP
ncbi:MAG: helix-turn-helix domain-containing protein [Propionibacteriaceae bacterium]